MRAMSHTVSWAALVMAIFGLDTDLDTEAAAILFIGTLQGLVMQSLLAGDVGHIRHDAPKVFAIYRRGIRRIV